MLERDRPRDWILDTELTMDGYEKINVCLAALWLKRGKTALQTKF